MSSIATLLFTLLLAALSFVDPSPVDINSAGENILQELPGIGPAKATSIIEFRERFGSFLYLEDLLLVPGIGAATLDNLEGLIRIGGNLDLPVDTLHWLPVEALGDTLLSISFLDVGNGDATLLQAFGGETWLLDGGPGSQGPLVAPAAARLLGMGIREFDTVMFTHPHADHIGGLPDVMRTFRVVTVRDPGMVFSSFIYEELLLAVLESGADYRTLESGVTYHLSSHVTLDVVYTGADQPVNLDLNESSAVFLVRCGDFSALVAGDIEDETEMLLSGSLPPLTLILAPHHGSMTSAFPPFLRGLRPQLAVFSAGRGNPFGHPHAEVLEIYSDLGAEILRTDQLGTIVVHTDGMSVLYSSSMRSTSP